MSVLKSKKFIITLITFLSVVFVSVGLTFGINSLTSQKEDPSTTAVRIYYSDEKPATSGVYYREYGVKPTELVTLPFHTITKGAIFQAASGDTGCLISSEDDLKFYADVTNFQVPDPEEYMYVGWVLANPSINLNISKQEYPFNYAFKMKIEEGWYFLQGKGDDYGLYAYFNETKDYTTNPLKLELKLTQDIKVSSSDYCKFRNFAGIFNGCGHSITFTGSGITTTEEYADGFWFRQINSGGEIKNVKFCNMKLIQGDGDSTRSDYNGGIVGTNHGTIDSCIVENLTFRSNDWCEYTKVAAIAGVNAGTIKNCYLTGEYNLVSTSHNLGFGPDGVVAYSFTALDNAGATLQSCIANWSSVNKSCMNECNCSECMESLKADALKTGNVDTRLITVVAPSSASTLVPNWDRNYYSNIGGETNMSARIPDWYYCATYNNGWPTLRVFMKWEEIKFVTDFPDAVTNMPSSIYVPSGIRLEATTGFSNKGSVKHISLMEQQVDVEPKSGYEVKGWEWDGSIKTFNIKIQKIVFKLTFYSSSNTEGTGLGSYTIAQIDNSITISKELLGSGGKNNAYGKIIFSFNDSDGKQREVTYTINNNKYYISKCKFNTGTIETVDPPTTYKVEKETSIQVETELKSYVIEFK